ncbi:hypothetical protein PPERSA_08394 [Pseudocohnilembus persalinus]|uniref:Uncharacterized protein n=1 Tax=Pseudocohnilembus persalinus TaxID=266149 RepID=A0A0V0R692_PSEPJ|nr:hypothetical protein PPERSA_08394 [Pseudocohnilembus persalinus]|eukprot:KRX09993.1 hypothetical protein PPERSA_08394 [Pseudocohnilembus persalinus]
MDYKSRFEFEIEQKALAEQKHKKLILTSLIYLAFCIVFAVGFHFTINDTKSDIRQLEKQGFDSSLAYSQCKAYMSYLRKAQIYPIIFGPKKLDSMILSVENKAELQEIAIETTNEFLKAIESGKEEDFPLMETNFYVQTQQALQVLRENKFTVKVVEDQEKFKQLHKITQSKILEVMHYSGLNTERAKNHYLEQYQINDEFAKQGLLLFFPPTEIIERTNTEDQELILQQQEQQKEKNAVQRNEQYQFLLRTHLQVNTPYFLQIQDQNGKVVSPQPLSFSHKITLENQLKSPLKYKHFTNNMLTYLENYRLSRDWYLVDVDGLSKTSQLVYQESQQKKLLQRSQ